MRLSLSKLSKWFLFVTIIVFTVTTNTRVNRIFCVLVVVICGLNMITRKEHKIRINEMLIGYLLYTLLLCCSSVYAIAPSNKVQSLLISCITTLVLSFFFLDNIETKEDVSFFLKAYMLGSVFQIVSIISVYGVYTIRIMQQTETSIRLGDDISNSNSIGMSLAYGALISVFLFIENITKHSNKAIRWIYVLIAVFTSVFCLMSGSRKALFVLSAGLIILFVFSGNRSGIFKRLGSIISAIIVVIVLLYVLNNVTAFHVINERMNDLLGGIFKNQTYDHSAATRFRFIREGLEAFSHHPILGEGVYSSYFYFGTYSHNNFVEVLMNTGIIGFLIFYFPYLIVFTKFISTNKEDKTYWIMLVFFAWILIGGYGMVTYYNKLNEFMVIMANQWILLNNREFDISNKLSNRFRNNI